MWVSNAMTPKRQAVYLSGGKREKPEGWLSSRTKNIPP